MEASTYSQTSTESDVCRDLIDFYMYVLITCFHESWIFYLQFFFLEKKVVFLRKNNIYIGI